MKSARGGAPSSAEIVLMKDGMSRHVAAVRRELRRLGRILSEMDPRVVVQPHRPTPGSRRVRRKTRAEHSRPPSPRAKTRMMRELLKLARGVNQLAGIVALLRLQRQGASASHTSLRTVSSKLK